MVMCVQARRRIMVMCQAQGKKGWSWSDHCRRGVLPFEFRSGGGNAVPGRRGRFGLGGSDDLDHSTDHRACEEGAGNRGVGVVVGFSLVGAEGVSQGGQGGLEDVFL